VNWKTHNVSLLNILATITRSQYIFNPNKVTTFLRYDVFNHYKYFIFYLLVLHPEYCG